MRSRSWSSVGAIDLPICCFGRALNRIKAPAILSNFSRKINLSALDKKKTVLKMWQVTFQSTRIFFSCCNHCSCVIHLVHDIKSEHSCTKKKWSSRLSFTFFSQLVLPASPNQQSSFRREWWQVKVSFKIRLHLFCKISINIRSVDSCNLFYLSCWRLLFDLTCK